MNPKQHTANRTAPEAKGGEVRASGQEGAGDKKGAGGGVVRRCDECVQEAPASFECVECGLAFIFWCLFFS